MDCLTCQEHFTALLEDGGAASLEARAHVLDCPACAAGLEEFRQTVRQLRALPLIAPPAQLLGQISQALDAEPVRARRGVALWQPLTAGLSMAACALLIVWTIAISPVNSPVGSPLPSTTRAATPDAVITSPPPSTPAVAAPATPGPQGRRARPPRLAGQPMVRLARPVRPAATPELPSFGSWGERLAQLPATAPSPAAGRVDGSTGKPPGTFAAGDPPGIAEAPLQRQAGAVQIAFAPPTEKPVGLPVVGEVTVDSQAEASIKVRVLTEAGLRVTNARGGVIYEGPMRKGQMLKLPVRLLAWRPGAHRVRLQLESDVVGVAADVETEVPGFVGELGKNGEALVSLTFRETPSHRAIRRLAAAAGARVVIHGDVETQLVTLDFSAGVPLVAALRILCDDCGYQLQERNGVYHILK